MENRFTDKSLAEMRRHGTPFTNEHMCFEAKEWPRCNFVTKELQHVWRQDNRAFVDVLQDVRVGKCTPRVKSLVAACRRPLRLDGGVLPTKLFCYNRCACCWHGVAHGMLVCPWHHAIMSVVSYSGVDTLNSTELARLNAPPVVFNALDVTLPDSGGLPRREAIRLVLLSFGCLVAW